MKKFTTTILAIFFAVQSTKKVDFFLHQERGELSFIQKQQCFLDMAHRLHRDGYLSVTPERFAKMALVVSYSESGLQTHLNNNGQQGINQLTADSRRRLNLPVNITKDCFLTQVGYFEQFLRCQGKTVIRRVKTPEALYAVNFSPSKAHKRVYSSTKTKDLKSLDMDKDEVITERDLSLFLKKRVAENLVVQQIYASL